MKTYVNLFTPTGIINPEVLGSFSERNEGRQTFPAGSGQAAAIIKQMKKITLIIIALFSFLYGSAQDISLIAGANFSTAYDQDGNLRIKREHSYITGFVLGISADFSIGDSSTFFEPGLLYANKGFIFETQQEVDKKILKTTGTYRLHYIDLPVNLKIKSKVGEKSAIYFSFGGYAAMGISGTIDLKGEYDGDTEILLQDVNWDSEDGTGLKRFDYGLNAGIGYRSGEISIGLNYQHGLQYLSTLENNQTDPQLRVISLRIGLYP